MLWHDFSMTLKKLLMPGRAPCYGMSFGADGDAQCASLPLLMGLLQCKQGCPRVQFCSVCGEDRTEDGVPAIFQMSRPWFFSMQRHFRCLQFKCSRPVLKENVNVFGLIVFFHSLNSTMLR